MACNLVILTIKPPPKLLIALGIDNTSVLRVVKPLYGIPKAGNHWFKTYYSHYINKLLMNQLIYNPCLLYSNAPFGIVGLQTDNILFLEDTTFIANKEWALKEAGFLAKPYKQLTTNYSVKFNSGLIQLNNSTVALTQEQQCSNL
jgi:hypothetical protein